MIKVLLHDLPEDANTALFSGKFDTYVKYAEDTSVHQCIGCINCRQSRDNNCVFDDAGSRFAKSLESCEEIVIISKCVFGSVSPYIKTMLDRSKPFMHTTLEVRNGEVAFKTHKNRMRLRACFYGVKEKHYEETAVKLMKMISSEWDAESLTVEFYENPFQVPGGDPQ